MSMTSSYRGPKRTKLDPRTEIEDICVIGSLGFMRLKDRLIIRLIQHNSVKNRKAVTSIKRPRRKKK